MANMLVLLKKKALREQALEELRNKRAELEAEKETIGNLVDEAETDEQITEAEGLIEANEAAIAELDGEIEAADEEIRGFDDDIKSLEQRSREAGKKNTEKTEREVGTLEINYNARTRVEKRARMAQAIKHDEVREFLSKMNDIAQKRAVDNTDILIPEIIVNMIEIDSQFVGNVVRLVRQETANGTARIIMAGDTPEAVWLECCGPLSELGLDFSQVELDCWKVGGFISICNATLDDAFINLGVHIVDQLVNAINKAKDKAVVRGEGATQKQPEGIIPNLPADNKVTSAANYADIIKLYAKLPDDAVNITMLMTRATYYTYFAPQTLAVTATGQVVMQPHANAVMPDGTPVVFVRGDVVPFGQILFGDFSKYFMLNRAGIAIARSTEVRFIEEQTLFKATARCDGKPVKNNYWVLVTLEDVVNP